MWDLEFRDWSLDQTGYLAFKIVFKISVISLSKTWRLERNHKRCTYWPNCFLDGALSSGHMLLSQASRCLSHVHVSFDFPTYLGQPKYILDILG